MKTYRYTDTEHDIITISYIDDETARSASFEFAESIDGRFGWDSLSDGYIRVRSIGRSIYLQYASAFEGLDADLLADAREFSRAIDACRSARREAEERASIDQIKAQPTPPPEVMELAQRYQWSSERAWEAEDERAWDRLRKWGY